MKYGQKLRDLRLEKKLTQEDVAKYLNIKRSSYKQFELQYDIIPINRLFELSNFFNVSIDYILGLNNNRQYEKNNDINIKVSANRLKDFRKENKLSQQKLADILNIDRTTLSHFERGRNIISTPFLYQICSKYNISADYLLGKIEAPKYLTK